MSRGCYINEHKHVILCEALNNAIVMSGRGVRHSFLADHKGKLIKSFVALHSGEFAKNGIVLNLCPFCGHDICSHMKAEPTDQTST